MELQQRINALRATLDSLRATPSPDPRVVADLESMARSLLADAKNTPQESAMQTLFGDIARLTAAPAANPATANGNPALRGLVRRARIRIEIAGDDDDIDAALDILAQAMEMDPHDAELGQLLDDAAQQSGQAAQRVNDLLARYGIDRRVSAPPPPEPRTTSTMARVDPRASQTQANPVVESGESDDEGDDVPPPPRFSTSAGYPAPEATPRPPAGRRTSTGLNPVISGNGGDVDTLVSELTQSYYAGEYQLTVEVANRILQVQQGNSTALDYRQKAEDNLIRGVVPDHRIPFDARVAYNRARSLERAGNYDEAGRMYRDAIDIATRSGIPTWKDAEQALLDIQDLALAREMIAEGDRLLAADSWSEAVLKYQGALAVVPNDPQAQQRLETARRVQQDAEQVSVQMSTLGGTLSEQAAQLRNVLASLSRVRQLLPNSQRVTGLMAEANGKLAGLKSQVSDQAQSALTRAASSTSLDERTSLSSEALKLLEVGMELDPSDARMSELKMQVQTQTTAAQRARQTIERCSAMIAQNFDNDLTQARAMLADLRDFAQDERYRLVVSDLLARYMERARGSASPGKHHPEAETRQPDSYSGADWRHPGDSGRDSRSDSGGVESDSVSAADILADGNDDTDGDVHAQCDADGQSYSDGQRHADQYSHAYGHAHAYRHADIHSDGHQYSDPHVDLYTNRHTYGDPDAKHHDNTVDFVPCGGGQRERRPHPVTSDHQRAADGSADLFATRQRDSAAARAG
jgi:tetratricopeptide (TPR) repeat protein